MNSTDDKYFEGSIDDYFNVKQEMMRVQQEHKSNIYSITTQKQSFREANFLSNIKNKILTVYRGLVFLI